MPLDRPPLRFTRHAADQALARGFRLSVLDMMTEVDAGRFEEDRPIGRHTPETRHLLLDAGPVLVVEGHTVVTVIRPSHCYHTNAR